MHKSANTNLCSSSSCGAGCPQCIYHLLEVNGVSIPWDTSGDVPKASSPPAGRLFIPRGQCFPRDVRYNPTVLVQKGSLCHPRQVAAKTQAKAGQTAHKQRLHKIRVFLHFPVLLYFFALLLLGKEHGCWRKGRRKGTAGRPVLSPAAPLCPLHWRAHAAQGRYGQWDHQNLLALWH